MATGIWHGTQAREDRGIQKLFPPPAQKVVCTKVFAAEIISVKLSADDNVASRVELRWTRRQQACAVQIQLA
jgi:hypothetical protein